MDALEIEDVKKPWIGKRLLLGMLGMFWKLFLLITPKRIHKYYTKEAIVAATAAWNVSSWFTLGQVAFAETVWPWIVAKVVLFITLSKVVMKDAKDAVVEAILIST